MESLARSREASLDESVMLNNHDLDWLTAFDIPPDRLDEPCFIDTLNQLNRQGSIDLRSLRHETDITQKTAIIQARYDFFALLGLSDVMAKIAEYRPTLPLPESFILLQREAHMLGLDKLAIIKKLLTGSFGRSDIRVKRMFEALQEEGLEPVRIINSFPNVLGLYEENIQSKIQYLESLGLNSIRIINSFPNVLGLSKDNVQSKVQYFTELGLEPVQVINRFPGVLGRSEENMQSKVQYLTELGLEPVRIINRFPNVFGLSEENMQSKVQCLESLGLNSIWVVHRKPNTLGLSEENIKSKIRCLEELGLESTRIVNRFPGVLGLSKENIQTKVIFFRRTVKLLKWEYPAEALLNTQPSLLTYNLGRLQILRRLLAQNVTPPTSKDCPPARARAASVRSLEACMIALAEADEGKRLSFDELLSQTSRVQRSLAQTARRATAKTIAESTNKTLGSRVCAMYLEYSKT